MGGGAEHYLSRTCTYGLRELIEDPAPTTSAAALGILVSQAPRGQEGSPSPCGCLADLLSVFPFKERLCKDKSFKARAQLPIKVARLADLHGDQRSIGVPPHFPGRIRELINNLQCTGQPLTTEKYPTQNVIMSALRLRNLVRRDWGPGEQVTQSTAAVPLGRTCNWSEKVAFATMSQ